MIGLRRRPTSEIRIEREAASRINSPQDLVVELERENGAIDYTRPLAFESPVPMATDWMALGISPTDTTFYSNHPLLRDGTGLAQSLLDRARQPPLPAVGTLTHPSFNASVQRLKKRPDITAIFVHYHTFLLLPDISFYVQWMRKTFFTFGFEAMNQVVSPRFVDYVETARMLETDIRTALLHTPPNDISTQHQELAQQCFAEAWLASIVAIAFMLLHEVGHIRLNHFRDSRNSANDPAAVESFWMAHDPHTGEHEADEFATKMLGLLRPKDASFANIAPEIKIPAEDLEHLFLLAMAGLFSTIAILDPSSVWQRLLHPTSHPSALSRSRRVLRNLNMSTPDQRLGNWLVRAASVL